MDTIRGQSSQRLISDRSLIIALIGFLLIGSIAISLLPESIVILLGALLIGLPLAALVIHPRSRNWAVVVILVLLPLTSILKAITGSRFAPLTFDLGILFACALHLVDGVRSGKLRLGKLDFLVIALWVIAAMEMFNPNVPSLQAGIEGFRKFIFMSLAFYIGRHLLQLRDMRFLSRAVVIFSLPITLYGIKQFFVMWPIDFRMIELATSSPITFLMGGWIRPFATMSGPFQLGLYLLITTLLILTLLAEGSKRVNIRLLLIGLLAIQLVLLLMTRTKGNWIGFITGVVVLILLQSSNPLRFLLRLGGFSLVGGLLLFAIVTFSSGTVATVLDDAIFAVTHPLEAPTLVFRIELWEETIIPAIRAHPFIGYGTSSAGEGLRNLYEGTGSQYFFSHNLYIKILLEMGLFGLLIFLWVVAESVHKGVRYLRRDRRPSRELKIIIHWSIAVVVSFLVGGLVIATLDAYPPNYYFWLALGILSRAHTLGISE